MLADIILSIFVLPTLWAMQVNTDGFLDLGKQDLAQPATAKPARIFTDYLDVKISAPSAIAVDVPNGKILYQKNADKTLPIASITKLMTALVFLDHNPGWQTEWTMTAADRRNGGILYLNTGESLSLDHLFKTALIVSDNNAAMALAHVTGLSDEDFISQMNAKAKALGLLHTHFADPTGLLETNQSTVGDVAKLLNYALQNDAIAKATGTAYYEFETTYQNKHRLIKLRNTDSLLGGYLNILGGKTGSLAVNGYNLSVKIQGEKAQQIIVVVLGSQSDFSRFQDAKAVSDWAFNNYLW